MKLRMKPTMTLTPAITLDLRRALCALGAVGLTWLSGCSTPPPPPPPPPKPVVQRPAPAPVPTLPQRPVEALPSSNARTPKDYRKDAAGHLYAKNSQRIYQGRMPPMLEAVGVLNVDIDRNGAVKSLSWMRAPSHVPRVMAEIERMVKAAAPYPVPKNMTQVAYTDVWLWHKSGKFQLDTLTEGQD